MITVDKVHPSDLSAPDRQTWLALCAATPRFENPLLGPDFAEAVGRVREDARVAVFRKDGAAVGFLAHHRRPSGFARPIGAPFSDYHALICGPDFPLKGRDALAAAGISAMRCTSLIDPHGTFGGAARQRQSGFVIRLGEGGAQAYLEALRAQNPKRFKNWRRLEHKLEREVGELALPAPDTSREAFDTLIRWKRDQLHRTGMHDFMSPSWAQALMDDLFERRTGDFQGVMITLRVGGRLIAGHFGVRHGRVYHPWISSIDPEGGVWSPGQALLSQAIAAMPALGLSVYDLAPGHEHYKAPFCLDRTPVCEGLVTAATPAGRVKALGEIAWAAAERRSRVVGKLHRRLDHIAAIELSVGGRLKGVVDAFAGQGRRMRAGADAAVGM